MSFKESLIRKVGVFSLAIVMSMPTLAEITFNEDTKLTKPESIQTYTAAEIRDIVNRAQQMDQVAQYELGKMYYNGIGVAQNYQKALEWYEKAANQGDVAAQYKLGVMYQDGEGVRQDYHKAVEWYTKASNQGYADAQFNLGIMYYDGKGVRQDYKKSFEWYRKAAN